MCIGSSASTLLSLFFFAFSNLVVKRWARHVMKPVRIGVKEVLQPCWLKAKTKQRTDWVGGNLFERKDNRSTASEIRLYVKLSVDFCGNSRNFSPFYRLESLERLIKKEMISCAWRHIHEFYYIYPRQHAVARFFQWWIQILLHEKNSKVTVTNTTACFCLLEHIYVKLQNLLRIRVISKKCGAQVWQFLANWNWFCIEI